MPQLRDGVIRGPVGSLRVEGGTGAGGKAVSAGWQKNESGNPEGFPLDSRSRVRNPGAAKGLNV